MGLGIRWGTWSTWGTIGILPRGGPCPSRLDAATKAAAIALGELLQRPPSPSASCSGSPVCKMSGAAAWTGGGSDALLRAQAEQCKLVETRNAQAKLSSKSAAQLTAQQLRISSYRMQGHGVAGNRVPDVYAQSLPPSDECDASNAALVSAAGDDALREERQAILSLPGPGLGAL
ncbi:hypothetical protein EMIHUDRAFT_201759 [Emiliania huxleyi CCMP1516]|uniref:Uncharacterized protein n=2 Tax=Emiliania huxleyi TaxID=2903 RepID=A0A0D3KIJ7_EMIH1|nr:hypothetical protein EMIHUDRAFT_201759 [Emiliania huxleyi CCMP1516]EOD35582.1 hypothetical protein EMIHUDRAFT_201759 [Emiliania huxleyi CCMP1516]|eukprot:XP_005788011.1 hypothetical protein EMIHUDRAFT_201759 [Emiliania huxleyi CCMP1516]